MHRRFSRLGFVFDIQTNLEDVDFFDMTLNLNDSFMSPFQITIESLQAGVKQVPSVISTRLP